MTIHLVLPAYNEAAILPTTLSLLYYCIGTLPEACRPTKIIVANNASTDATRTIADGLLGTYPTLTILDVPEKGKGAAVMTAWQTYPADINIFLDADLATDLSILPELISTLRDGVDIAVGSRRAPGARVARTAGRLVLSHGLRFMLWALFRLRTKDVACGAKAINRRTLTTLVPVIHERDWSFDTELIIRAERAGYRIRELPVTWSDARDAIRPSSVSIFPNIIARIRAMWRIKNAL